MTRVRLLILVAVGGVFAVGCGDVPERPTAAVAEDRPSGTIVFADGSNRLTAIDVATGRKSVRRIASAATCGPQMYVTGGRVIFAGFKGGRTIVYSAPIALDRKPTRLGSAHAFVPSARDGRVWLAGTDCHRSRMTGVREVTVDGEVTVESGRRVPGEWVAGAVSDGLVLHRDGRHVVWDPATGRTTRTLDLDVAGESRGDVVSGCADGTGCRELVLANAATGRTLVPHAQGYRIFPSAKFSPDGSLVATTAVKRRRWRVALVDVRSGRHTLVPGRWTERYPETSWTAGGWLLIRSAGSRRVAAFRPGAARTVDVPVRLPKDAAVFVAG